MLNVVVTTFLPPASLALLAFILVLAGPRWRRLGLAALFCLILLSLPVVPALLLAALAPSPAGGAVTGAAAPEAIVILSADGILLEDPADLDPGLLTLDRMRAGASLHRRTGLPILVTGGFVLSSQTISLAAMMARSLEQDFRVEVRWQEPRSRDTWENAEFSAAILRQAGISRVYVVTHAWHMRRALIAFRRFGLEATPSPIRPGRPPILSIAYFIPRAAAWEDSYFALHEWIGMAYYALRR